MQAVQARGDAPGERSAPPATQCAFVSSSHDGRGAVRQEEQEVHTTSSLETREDSTSCVVALPRYELVRGEFVRGAISIRELYAYSPQ